MAEEALLLRGLIILSLCAIGSFASFSACGGTIAPAAPARGTGSAYGSVDGLTLAVADAYAFVDYGSGHGCGQCPWIIVVLQSRANACAFEEAHPNDVLANATTLTLTVHLDTVGTFPAMYSSGTGPVANADLSRSDMQCSLSCERANGGEVTIDSITAEEVTGSYDLTFGHCDGAPEITGTLKGAFTAPRCAPTYDPPDGGRACIP